MMKPETKSALKTILLHALGIVAFLLLPVLTNRTRPGDTFFDHPVAQKEMLVFLFLLIYFYLNYYWWIPRYYLSQRWLLYFGLLLMSYPVIALLPSVLLFGSIAPPMPRRPHGPQGVLFFELSIHFFHFLVVTLLSLSIRINEQLKLVKEKQTRAELDYLRSQINPHFLFNTLNSIYALSLKNDPRTPAAIVKLSGLMRYVYTETAGEHVSLENEISHIDDYISLQSLRLGTTVDIQYTKTGVFEEYQIAPLLLMPFIENAFKHGIVSGGKSWIHINIEVSKGMLKLHIANSFSSPDGQNSSQGIGITNTIARLNMLYPERYQLNLQPSHDRFELLLNINLL